MHDGRESARCASRSSAGARRSLLLDGEIVMRSLAGLTMVRPALYELYVAMLVVSRRHVHRRAALRADGDSSLQQRSDSFVVVLTRPLLPVVADLPCLRLTVHATKSVAARFVAVILGQCDKLHYLMKLWLR